MLKITLLKVFVKNNVLKYNFSVSKDLEKYFTDKQFVIEYQENIEHVPEGILCIPFVASVLPIVWFTDSVLEIKELDKDFYECIPELIKGYKVMFPNVKNIGGGRLEVQKVVENTCSGSKSAMLFSGGLDAVNTLIRNIDKKPDLITLWGSDIKFENQAGFAIIADKLKKVADDNRLEYRIIRTNFRGFDNEDKLDYDFSSLLGDGWWHGIKHGIGILSHVAPLAYLYGYSSLYIASSNCVLDKDIKCASSPYTDNCVKFNGCQVFHDGFEMSRQDKCRNLVEYYEKTNNYIPLHVCWESQTGNNCSCCEKCYRTMFGIIAEGGTPENYGFSNVINNLKNSRFYIAKNKYKYKKACIFHWSHIQNSFIKHKQIIKQTDYYKYVKWIYKVDFTNLDTIKIPVFKGLLNKAKGFIKKCKRIINRIKNKIKSYVDKYKFLKKIKSDYKRVDAFLVMTPEHDNIGDHAIALAEIKLFKDNSFKYSEISDADISRLKKYNRLNIFNGKKILIHGGGNLGTLWIEVEYLMREIIKNNPKSKIVFLPNTVYYEDSEWGREELKKSMDVYNSHTDLHIFAREKTSFEYMKKVYKNVLLCPDMVLYLSAIKETKRQNKCTLFLRHDKEKTMDIETAFNIESVINSRFKNCVYSDTVVDYCISIPDREKEVQKKLDEFRSSELVITDRLHGMVFSALTGTPCIVLNSKSPKVKGCYQWIKDLEYIKFCDDLKDLDNLISSMPKKFTLYDSNKYKEYYKELVKYIKG